jgi:hypothetical protein
MIITPRPSEKATLLVRAADEILGTHSPVRVQHRHLVASRGQDRQRSAARAETPDQRRHLRLPAGRRPARRSRRGEEPGGNWGTTLIPGRPALTPNAGSSGKPLSGLPPTPLLPFPRRCHPVRAGGRVKDGRSPAAQRRPQGVLDPVAPEPIMPAAEKGGASAHGQLPRPEAGPASPQRSALDRETKRCSICAAYRPCGRCRDGARRWVMCTRVLIWAGPVSRSVAIAGRVRIKALARDCFPVMRGQLVRLRPSIDRSALGFSQPRSGNIWEAPQSRR